MKVIAISEHDGTCTFSTDMKELKAAGLKVEDELDIVNILKDYKALNKYRNGVLSHFSKRRK